jgi:hypothetical protein
MNILLSVIGLFMNLTIMLKNMVETWGPEVEGGDTPNTNTNIKSTF